MFRNIKQACIRACNPYKGWLGLTFIIVGVVLLMIFVPVGLWLAVLGAGLVVLGCILLH